jgi:2-polyprenyl-3-methyl-5-hydroxy-6-metoxy-1,4-benzoquinol methylase
MPTSTEQLTNPEKDQDRVADTVDHFNRFGYVMFPQQRKIYQQISNHIKDTDWSVLEAGCGNGVGSAIIERTQGCYAFTATDKLVSNLNFAACLYPWIDFYAWDLNQAYNRTSKDIVVCVETFEHVEDPKKAMKNLLDAANNGVIISTPNGEGKFRPPHNPYHVCEYTPAEMMSFIETSVKEITFVDYKTWCPCSAKDSPEIITMVITK